MTTDIFKFLSDNYAKLPLPFRVIVYCLVLVVFIYLLLIPQYIDGELVIKDETGGEIPFRGMIVSLKTDGRVIKMTTNEDGMWAIPLASKLPLQSLELNFLSDKKRFPVKIPYGNVVSGNVKVVYSEEENGTVNFDIVGRTEEISFGLIPAAYAAALPLASPLLFAQLDSAAIAGKIAEIIRRVLKKPDLAIADSMHLRDDLGMSDAKISVLKYHIEKELGFSASDEQWADVTTVGKLVAFIIGRKGIG